MSIVGAVMMTSSSACYAQWGKHDIEYKQTAKAGITDLSPYAGNELHGGHRA